MISALLRTPIKNGSCGVSSMYHMSGWLDAIRVRADC